jgi:hypothetical protein
LEAPSAPDLSAIETPTEPDGPIVHHPPISFWQQEHVVNILSFASSLVLHLAIVVIGLLFFKVQQAVTAPPVEQVIIPDAAIVENAPIGGVPNPGLGGDPERAAAQDQVRDVSTNNESWNAKRGESLTASLMEAGAGEANADSVIAPGVRPGFGTGNASGSGNSDGGDASLAPFGVPGGGARQGPRVSFVGVSGNARRVAYIVDASGTMMSIFVNVRHELHKSIDVLKPSQAFNIFFFSESNVKPYSKDSLRAATPDNKRNAYKFAESVIATGATDPIPAIRMAFQQKPELIYILTDGFENATSLQAIVDEFRRLNPDKKVKVNALLIRSAPAPELEKVLREIVKENGGVYKPISLNDF